MRVPRGLALAVVSGGIALGVVLGTAANPEMKEPPERPWEGASQVPVYADPAYPLADARPQNLSPYPDSYAPAWANEELADWEPDYPAWSYSDFSIDPGEELAEPPADDQPAAAESAVPAPSAASPGPAEPLALAPPDNLAPLY